MKKFLFSLILLSTVVSSVYAQKNMVHRVKFEGMFGTEAHSTDAKYMVGGEMAYEMPMFGKKNWHYTYNFPTVGFALGYMNLAGTDSISHIAYTYPYFLWPFVHTPMVAINLRGAHGVGAYVDFANTDTHKRYFPYVGVYSLGLTGDFFLGKMYGNPWSQWQITLGGNLTLLHDGFISRNTMIMLLPYANLGVKYTPNVYPLPIKHPARPVRHIWGIEGSLNGGVNQLSVSDDDNYYPTGSLNVGLYYPFSNAFRMGFGIDGFFNSIYDGKQRDDFHRYNFIDEDKLINKIRGGIFWANEVTVERFSAGIHIGFYPWNPIKVPDSDDDGCEFKSNLEKILYEKFVTKYKFTKHFYATTQLKTHLTAVENFEVGIGYYMADFGARVKSPFSRISFKKEDPNELKVEGETYSKKPFRHNELFDE
ncbi:MAG: hypothetical protein MJZ23_05600 [Paludibacteraceae bacterium]|nr:hypothetical protein [Paludibacteraceae bacterium]